LSRDFSEQSVIEKFTHIIEGDHSAQTIIGSKTTKNGDYTLASRAESNEGKTK